MTGADLSASHGRPEYVIPSLDLEGYFAGFFESRRIWSEKFVPATTATTPPHPVSEPSPSDGIENIDEWVHGLASDPDLRRQRPWKDRIDAIQKKFAVFGRIQRSYDGSMRKTTEIEARPSTLCRLARIFFLGFQADGDWNALNTAVKLVEKAAASGETSDPADDEFRHEFALALRLETEILRGLVDA